MPIYEYQALHATKNCDKCKHGFETIQGLEEEPLVRCPDCHHEIKKLISKCHAAVYEQSRESVRLEKKIQHYEKTNRWSHAAELADTLAHQSKNQKLKDRALDNYKKAGYDPATLDRHSKIDDD